MAVVVVSLLLLWVGGATSTVKDMLSASGDEGGKKGEDSGAMRKIGWLLSVVVVVFGVLVLSAVFGERQVDGRAEESFDSISGCGRPISGTVEMWIGAVFPRR